MASVTSPSSSVVNGNGAPTATSQTFTCFPNLPLELRNTVWEYASNQPRNLDIWAPTIGSLNFQWSPQHDKTEYTIHKFCSTQPVPGVLHANRESRVVALKFYELSFGSDCRFHPGDILAVSFPARIYHNVESDRLCPMGSWGEASRCHFWTLNPPSSCAVNICDADALNEIREILDNDPDDPDDSLSCGCFQEIILYRCEDDLSKSGLIEFMELSEGNTTAQEWTRLCQEQVLLLQAFERFQMAEKERIRDRHREKGDNTPEDPETWYTAPRIKLMAIVVDGMRR